MQHFLKLTLDKSDEVIKSISINESSINSPDNLFCFADSAFLRLHRDKQRDRDGFAAEIEVVLTLTQRAAFLWLWVYDGAGPGPAGWGLFPVASVHSWVVASCDVSCQKEASRAAVTAFWEECERYQMSWLQTWTETCLHIVIFIVCYWVEQCRICGKMQWMSESCKVLSMTLAFTQVARKAGGSQLFTLCLKYCRFPHWNLSLNPKAVSKLKITTTSFTVGSLCVSSTVTKHQLCVQKSHLFILVHHFHHNRHHFPIQWIARLVHTY